MRTLQLVLAFASIALLFNACSSSSGGSNNQPPSVTEDAKGKQFNQGVIDDFKMARVKSDAILPDVTLLTSTNSSSKSAALAKLNAEGQTWFRRMQTNCLVTTSGELPGQQGSGSSTVTISGAGCAVAAKASTTLTNNFNRDSGSSDMSLSATETVLDQALIDASGTRQVVDQFQTHVDFSNSNQTTTTHLVQSGTVDIEFVSTKLHIEIKTDMSSMASGERASSSGAVAIHLSSDRGRTDLGIIADTIGMHYYIAGREVSQVEFTDIVGDIGLPTAH